MITFEVLSMNLELHMRFSPKIALRVAAVGVVTAAIGLPLTSLTSAQAAGSPTVTVSTSISLTDGQEISVTGTNFPATAAYTLVECATPATATNCAISNLVTGTTDGSGGFTTSYTVHSGAIGAGTCGKATPTSAVPSNTQCVLAASTDAAAPDATNSASVNIFFNPIVTLSHSTGLKAGQSVTVSGAGYPGAANQTVYVVECSGPVQADCDLATLVQPFPKTTATGTFGPATLKIVYGSFGGSAGSCTSASTKCLIAASTSISGVAADEGQSPITLAALPNVKTATAAKASQKKVPSTKKFTISGTVKAAGKGVSGLKATLYDSSNGKKWKKIATLTTKSGGKFKSSKIKGPKKSEKYEVKTLKQVAKGNQYLASASKVITVKK
jgi:Neocarzinostatin family